MRGSALTLSVLAASLVATACAERRPAGDDAPADGAPPPATAAAGAAGRCSEGPIFDEIAAAAGLDFRHWNGMTGEHYLPEITGSGAAVFDYDGDGDLDVYLVQMNLLDPQATDDDALEPPPGPLPLSDRLFRNDSRRREDGTLELAFTDVTEAAGLAAATGYGMGVAAGDADGDGDPDLYVTNLGRNQLWINRGDGTFVEGAAEAGADDQRWSVPAVFFDYDRDGRLDLWVGSYVNFNLGVHRRCRTTAGAPDWCGPLSYLPEPDRLLRNLGGGRFEDVTRDAGLAGGAGTALGAVAADFNGDGWPDLYVANDQMANFLWVNQGDGTFREDALFAGAALSGEGRAQASMGVDAGDVDGDGDLDLFITHLSDEMSALYLNDGKGGFVDASAPSGVGMASWKTTGFGTAFLDYDNDGLLDLLSVNGAVRVIPEQLAAGKLYPLEQTQQLFRNAGGGRFEEVTAIAGPWFASGQVARGAAFGDLDDDGDTDVVVNDSNGPARLLVNGCGSSRSWIGLAAIGRGGWHALGALIELRLPDGRRLVRRVHTDGSFASSNDPRVLVGLGEAERAENVTVTWPDGGRESFGPLDAGRYHRLVESGGRPADGP